MLALLALGVAVAGIWMGARAEMLGRVGELALRRAVGARPRHLWRYWMSFVGRHFGGAMLVGAWLAVALAVELERSYGMPPILDARIWIAAALPLFGAFLTGSLPPFLRARRAAPASRLEGET
jgi:putative ABC transport system permease protein